MSERTFIMQGRDHDALERHIGPGSFTVRLISDGVVPIGAPTTFIDLPEPPAGVAELNLRAPERVSGEPDGWLTFDGRRPACWSRDLLAVVVTGMEES